MTSRPLSVVAVAALPAVAISLVVVAAPAHAAEAELATLPAQTPLAAFAGRVVFSEQRADGLWHLRQWAAGAVRDVGVPPQRRPFDVDAGPDAAGDPMAVYSRCATDPSEPVLFSPLPDLSRSTGCAIHQAP
jgi:hypothetical protein